MEQTYRRKIVSTDSVFH